jgi:hypothetical protein
LLLAKLAEFGWTSPGETVGDIAHEQLHGLGQLFERVLQTFESVIEAC